MHKPISKIEWAALITFCLVVDLVQIGLNLAFGSGVAINRFITFVMAFLVNGYLWFRGVSLVTVKQLVNSIATVTGESIPIADSLPIWTISLIVSWISYKADTDPQSRIGKLGKNVKVLNLLGSKLKPKPGVAKPGAVPPVINSGSGANQATNMRPPPLNVNGVRQPRP